jgi:glycine/D-amino acid oxidase-like deaminating enzyme
VVTEAGRIGCDHVVVAGGSWSRLFLRGTGSHPATFGAGLGRGDRADAGGLSGNAGDDDFAFRRREDGGYTIAPGGAA